MDGNRRWAKRRKLPTITGHWEGVDVLMNTVQAAKELGIKAVTVYAFSTENWNRSKQEVGFLLKLFETALIENCYSMVQNGVQLHTIGNLSQFPSSFLKTLQDSQKATEHCRDIELILALNYGGRDDIRRAMLSIFKKIKNGVTSSDDLNEDLISAHLDTSRWEDPDLLIRTSGEQRLSNFLLWQLSYTEVHVTDVLWPDFSPHNLLEAVIDFQRRDRRLGGL